MRVAQSAERRLPLLVVGLLAAGIIGIAGFSYREMRREALQSAQARLSDLSRMIADQQFSANARARIALTRQAAGDPAVAAFLQSPTTRTAAAASRALERAIPSVSPLLSVEVWDTGGRTLLPPAGSGSRLNSSQTRALMGLASVAAPATAGPLMVVADTPQYPIVGAVVAGDRVRGYVVQRVRVSGSSRQQVRQLLGSGGSLYVGNAAGDVWSDLTSTAPAPPVRVGLDTTVIEYERPGAGGQLAIARKVAGTPWVVLLEFPRAVVLQRSQAFLLHVSVAAAALLLVGAVLGWRSSRSVTEPYDRALRATITERLVVDEALAESERQYLEMVARASVGIYRSSIEGRILTANPTMARMLGYGSPDELTAHSMRELYARPAERDAVLGNEGSGVEVEWKRRDGSPVWVLLSWHAEVDERGIPRYFEGFVTDITARRRAQQELRQSEAHYRTILEHIGDAVVITTPDGHYLDVNPQACAMTGYDRDELLRLRAVDTYPLEEREAAAARAAEVASGRSIVFDRRLLRKDGTVIIVEINARPLPDGRLLAAMRDITERRNLENQLRQAQKMEAVGRLAGGLAHDFNNVLTAVFGYVDLLSEELAPGSHAREDVEEIRRAAERAAALTRQLLAFSRQQVLDPIVLSVNDLIRNLDKMLRRLIGEDVDLRLNLAPDVGNVRADPGQVEQVIANLVVNARDAMPEGGKLLIETVNADLTEQYADMHRPVIAGAYVMIAVSDTGVGMDEATKARIFEPFFTTKEKGRGTGLGLSTVYGIVKQSGGYIWAYSEVGRGTTFKIYLPRVDAPAVQVAAPREAGTLAGSETVLLAEDDPMLRPLAKTLLQKLGYTVLEAENPDQAVALAAAHPAPIHLLVADVVMPGASGRDLARRLAASRPDMKVLYVSGYTDDAIVHHGMLEPGLNFLQKPFTPAALARKVRDVLDST